MAQGTFDILHPGHLHYLRESAALGDDLVVVIARDSRIRDRKPLFMDEESRRELVAALEMVDEAILGSEGSIFESVDRLAPDVITLGHDQGFDAERLSRELAEAGFEGIEVVRIGAYDGPGPTSSSDIKAAVQREYGDAAFESIPDTGE
jgi:FAD synthetase